MAHKSLLLYLVLSVGASAAFSPAFAQDLSISKGENALFVVGMLDDYSGRLFGDDSDVVERFYCNEHVQAYVFRVYLDLVAVEQNIDAQVERKSQDCLIYWHSPELSRFINSFYRSTIVDRRVADYSAIEVRRGATLSYQKFEHADRALKLAYLAGAYFRYGRANDFIFANSVDKLKLVSRLLEDVGCSEVSLSSRQGIPVSNTVSFKPTAELLSWFDRMPGATMIDKIDSYVTVPDSDEFMVYTAVLRVAKKGSFEGCQIRAPFSLYRMTFIDMGGDARFGAMSGSIAEAVTNYNDTRLELLSLRSLEDDSTRLCSKCDGMEAGCVASFLRIGFDKSRNVAVTFITSVCGGVNPCSSVIAVFLQKKEDDWLVTGYSVRGR